MRGKWEGKLFDYGVFCCFSEIIRITVLNVYFDILLKGANNSVIVCFGAQNCE